MTAQPADAPSRDRRRRRAAIALTACAAAVVAIVVLGIVLSGNVVYFRTVSEAVHERDEQGDDRFRIAGEVVQGSQQETRDGIRFEITDGRATALVVHRGSPPDLFDDEGDVPVVCEGRWSDGAAFASDRILIRHGNEYNPPDVDAKGAEAE